MLYTFDDFTLNLETSELRRKGRTIGLQRLPLDLLAYLVQHRDRVVTKDELLDNVWKGVVVGDGAVTQAIAVVRRALGEGRANHNLISTVRGRGYRFSGRAREIATHSALGNPTSRLEVEATQVPFIGRHEVMRILDRALEDSLRGHARLVLLSGLPGMGKTRICKEIAAIASRRGMRVLHSTCSAGAAAYWPWVQMLRQVEAASADGDEFVVRETKALVAKLAPAGGPGLDGSWTPLDEPSARSRFFERFVQLGVRILRTNALIVILDDLHDADAASLELLQYLTRGAAPLPILFVTAFRENDARRRAEVGQAIDRLSRTAGVVRYELTGMDRSEVARLFHAVSAEEPGASVVEALSKRTGGNPFFVQELARLAGESARGAANDQGLPLEVAGAVRRHIEMISARCRKTLASASALGSDFDAPLVAAATERDLTAVLEDLDEAVASGLVIQTRGAGVGYRFVHMLVCEALYDEMAPSQRATLHARIGGAIEKLPGAADMFVTELAEHFYKAAVYEPKRCVRYARAAALRAMYSFGFEEAARHYRRALEVFPYAGSEERLRLQLLLGLGMAHARRGDFEQAGPILLEAMDLSRVHGERELQAWAAYGFCSLDSIDKPAPTMIRVLEDALAVYDDPTPLRVLLLAQLAYLLWFVPPLEKARACAREAVALGRKVDQPDALALALNRAHRITAGRAEEVDQRFAYSSELAELRGRIREPQTRLESHLPVAWDALFRGDRIAFDREVDALAGEAHQIGQPYAMWYMYVYEATRAHLAGHFDRAEELARSAQAGRSPGGKPFAEHVFTLQYLGLCLDRGRHDEVVSMLEQRLSAERDIGWMLHLTLCRVALGEVDEPARYVADVVRNQLPKIPRNVSWLADLCCLAEICTALNLTEEGAVVYDELLGFQQYQDIFGAAWIHRGSVARPLGNLAALRGDWESARRHFENALESDRKLGAVQSVARDQYAYALCLIRAGNVGNGVRELLSEATNTARGLGMRQLEASAEALRSRYKRELSEINSSGLETA